MENDTTKRRMPPLLLNNFTWTTERFYTDTPTDLTHQLTYFYALVPRNSIAPVGTPLAVNRRTELRKRDGFVDSVPMVAEVQ